MLDTWKEIKNKNIKLKRKLRKKRFRKIFEKLEDNSANDFEVD